jgi:segregation and condensation protein B
MRQENLKAAIEAALFMTSEPISLRKLSNLFKISPEKARIIIEELKIKFEQEEHGIHILETEQGYQMKVKPEFTSFVRTLTPYKDLGKGMLRVLAMVAYKQPITQSEIVKVIGNRTYEYVKRLQERGLIKTEKHGRTRALIATKEFANYFGLESTEDLKKFFDEITEEETA